MNTQGWAEGQTLRIGKEVRRLRDAQDLSARELADRTADLGHHVTRTAITDLEIGRRKQLTVAELTVLAYALNTAPVALIYPGPYDHPTEVLPVHEEVSEARAAQWFCGLPEGHRSLADNPRMHRMNLRRLRLARQIWDLEEKGIALRAQMTAADEPDTKAQLVDALADLQGRIDDLKAADDGR
ncbi:helix-turn-helix domain-containing protein [Mycobacterium sp. 852014-52144_SCH5372336]|uniref:helix-turn-helix domain-containing protein n=1 Tax=Mycobacterium sp. 852014-52144_SCH5372336 TaxID=1834115 RepID=UPI0008014081|nr:helix-turn-helix domain-containing protein [Mycobacterium sp. 852014-52144_SCH5372336]OBB71575.1 hypothetical protein A5759_20595 [Mycobacterium sp. 852014-52144_SCH5372336]